MAEQPTPPNIQQPGAAESQYGPVPTAPNAPYEQQPVNQQYFAQPQAAPVQYVVMAQSLRGVKGWLALFTVCLGFTGISLVGVFFLALVDLGNPFAIISLIFTPIITVLSILAVVFITSQKKIGKWLAVATLITLFLYSTTSTIVDIVTKESSNANSVINMASSIVTSAISTGLLCLYFFVSRRVKETLVR